MRPTKTWVWMLGVCCMVFGGRSLPAAVYVVDNQNPAASDEGPGSADKPWKTVQHAANLAKPVDTVCIMEGAYDEKVTLKASGAEHEPIVFRGLPRQKVQIGGVDTGKTSWVRIE